ncbi:zinc ribbon domain-containing protein [Alteromonadaceae bacterium BrNp21-10]|nr:zinc ribbon domain-containing protein [Alteromonadaceae bacterium BrNp21-10]
MNSRIMSYFCWPLLSVGYLLLCINYHSVVAEYFNITTENLVLALTILGGVGYLSYLLISEKTLMAKYDIAESKFAHEIIKQGNKFGGASFNLMLVISSFYFFLYLNQNDQWQQGLNLLVGMTLSLLFIRVFNKWIATKLSTLMSLIIGIVSLILVLYVLHHIDVMMGHVTRDFTQFMLQILLGFCSISFIVLLAAFSSYILKKLWRLFRYFSYEHKLMKHGAPIEQIAIDDLELYLSHILDRRIYFAMLVAPLFFALSAHVDIRLLSILWLSAAFLPVCIQYSRYVAKLASEKYFLMLKVTFQYLFWALVTWSMFLHLSFYLYCIITQWYWDSSLASNGLLPNFLLAYNNMVSKDVLLAQLEGTLYSFILLIQVVYFIAACATKKFKRATLQVVTLGSFFTIAYYNHKITLSNFDIGDGALLTPAIIMLTLIPIAIDLLCQSMQQINAKQVQCGQCQQSNKSIYNFCQLCGASLFGAKQKLSQDCNDLLSDLVTQLSKQIQQNKFTLEQASELLKVKIEGMHNTLKITKNDVNLDNAHSNYLTKLHELLADENQPQTKATS